MKSRNLVDWEMAGYVYDTLADRDQLTLENGQNAYGRGSWASSIRYKEGTYYVATFSYTTNKTYVYKTDDVEHGPWTESTFNTVYHDPSLLLDDDGRVYLVYGSRDIKIVELVPDARSVKQGGLAQVLINDAGRIAGSDFYVPAEGTHIHKIDGMYYIFLITWPRGSMRTQLVYRAERLTGPYEGRIALRDSGIAQGGLVETPEGNWYAMLFQDHESVGRIPYLVPVAWEDGWPVFGSDGRVPLSLGIPSQSNGVPQIVASDEFDDASASGRETLALAWQWNHNPDDQWWSVSERPGSLRLTNGRLDTSFVSTRNTLTQRTFGPECAATVALDVEGMKNGDYAGLGVLQEDFGFVGVTMVDSSKSIVMVNGSSEPPLDAASLPINRDVLYLGVEVDYRNRTDRANFYYSFDGKQWKKIGNTLSMSYKLSHFMGYRFALFTYATVTTGGFADFDYFRLGKSLDDVAPPIQATRK